MVDQIAVKTRAGSTLPRCMLIIVREINQYGGEKRSRVHGDAPPPLRRARVPEEEKERRSAPALGLFFLHPENWRYQSDGGEHKLIDAVRKGGDATRTYARLVENAHETKVAEAADVLPSGLTEGETVPPWFL